jgi:phosphoglycerate dehydrogenase-like enzyme/glyoxylase-like metal-dependent hydrolase (beta-lactamase superfamily II)
MRSAVVCLFSAAFLMAAANAPAADLPKMKFNEVKEVAPGVFFRYSAISATNPSIFGGSNNIWVVFEDYVAVIDANFPKEAADVIAAIKKTTDKPIRYVFDTHHHGDHSYGNAVFAKEGASVVAQANCARLLRVNGPREFAEAGRGAGGRKDVAESTLKVPNVVFDDKLVLDDGKQRIEFLFMGHAHTAGDGVAYLPKHKILCTGDACVNGAFNFMGHSDSASWIRALEKMQQLDVQMVCPGHGPVAGKDLLETQKRYFVELRRAVQKGIDANKDVEEIIKGLDMPWYKDWTGVTPAGDNVKHVYNELTGRIAPWDLTEDFGVLEGPSPTKDSPGWKKPRRIVVPSGMMPARLAELKAIAPEVEFIPAKSPEEAAKVVGDADAVIGYVTPEVIKAGKDLRWGALTAPRLATPLPPEVANGKIVLTNTRGLNSPEVADQAFALLLALNRQLSPAREGEAAAKAPASAALHGKTMLLIGLGEDGRAIARRANAFGLRVQALDPKETERPEFVFSLNKPDRLMDLLPKADVVVLAAARGAGTPGMMGEKQFQAMKPSALFISVASADLIQRDALLTALENKNLAGAGLDVSSGNWPNAAAIPAARPNLLRAPLSPAAAPEYGERSWRLLRENVRRFVAGEPLLCVVDKERGY